MSYLQGKTPISYLQELCTKRSITPQYDLIANEGAVHEPTFVFKVTAGEFIGTGKGPSKKKARHNAALSVLNQMQGMTNSAQPVVEDYSELAPGGASGDGNPGNPVGELQELTQKRLWRPPIYKYVNEPGPTPGQHKEFICKVHLGNMTVEGSAKSKKGAKRAAAMVCLQKIRTGLPANSGVGPENKDEIDDDQIPMPHDLPEIYVALDGKTIPTLTANASGQITEFYSKLKAKPGKQLSQLATKLSQGGKVSYGKILEQVAKEHRFEVSYVDISERNQTGQAQSLCQLSSLPVAVCYGLGPSVEDARNHAAHNALQYLRIMTSK